MVIMVFALLLSKIHRHPCSGKVFEKLYGFICWNWCIRLILEAAMELSFCVIMNLYYGSYTGGTWAMKFNYIVSIFFGAILVLSPVFIFGFYGWNFHKLADEEFKEKWGAPYESLKTDRKMALLYPVTFIGRRVIFACMCLFMPGFLFG